MKLSMHNQLTSGLFTHFIILVRKS